VAVPRRSEAAPERVAPNQTLKRRLARRPLERSVRPPGRSTLPWLMLCEDLSRRQVSSPHGRPGPASAGRTSRS
jgi:hypothetical protein